MNQINSQRSVIALLSIAHDSVAHIRARPQASAGNYAASSLAATNVLPPPRGVLLGPKLSSRPLPESA